jgi:zinc protease
MKEMRSPQADGRNRASHASLPGSDDTLRKQLPNGLTVLVRENFASPAVVISGYVKSGALDESPEQYGLAGFTGDVMQRGTSHRTFRQLYADVESIGATFGLSTATTTSSFAAKGLADSLPLLLDVLADILRHPSFPETQVEKARAEILTDLQERRHDTRRMASLKFYELAYPETHPYHWSQLGYKQTIQSIGREDLVAFHRDNVGPEGAVIVIVGGIQMSDAVSMVEEALGDWETSRVPRAPMPSAPPLTERRESRVTLADKTQSNLVLGWPGPPRRHKDFIPCYVANTILGTFGMYGRLGTSIREAHGLAYYIYSRVDGGPGPGPWRIHAGINPANVDRSLSLIRDEIRRMQDTRVPQEELADSQSYLTGSLPLHLETNEGVARSLINIERHDLGLDYLRAYQTMIQSITADEVQRVTQDWMDTERDAVSIAEPDSESEGAG